MHEIFYKIIKELKLWDEGSLPLLIFETGQFLKFN